MSSKSRRRTSSQIVAPTRPTAATLNRGLTERYTPATARTQKQRTGRNNLLIRLGGILGLALLLWGGLLLFAPSLLPPPFNPSPAAPAQYFAGERISFVRTSSEGKRDLYVVNADGTNQQQVTRDIAVQGSTLWSPDGRQIVMQADIGGTSKVLRYTIGPDNRASKTAQLTADIQADSALPVWSPDGKQIAFQTKRDGGDYQIYVMGPDGNGKNRLSNGKGYAGQPAWSPDSKNVIYVAGEKADPGTAKELYVAPSAGGAPRQITHLGVDLSRPSWSPDGKNITYMQNQGERNRIIVIANIDGTSPRVLVQSGANYPPQFSPFGDKVVYYAVSPSGGSDIYTITTSPGAPNNVATNLTPQSSEDYGPSWSTDGKKLSWASRQGSSFRIVTANADGSNVKAISQGEGDDYQPGWGAQVK